MVFLHLMKQKRSRNRTQREIQEKTKNKTESNLETPFLVLLVSQKIKSNNQRLNNMRDNKFLFLYCYLRV